MLNKGELGVHPPGALGVGFFIHATADCFIGRTGDGITEPLKAAGAMRLQQDGKLRTVSLKKRIFTNLLEADALKRLPELLFVCCNPNQLGDFTGELTRFLENLCERGRLQSIDDVRTQVPILLVLPNGILAEQTVQTFTEQLHEALLMDRLPGVDEEVRQALLARVVRGISLQAGGRRGSGPETVYLLEKKGSLLFAGGGEFEGNRIEHILKVHDYPATRVRGVPGTRIEFDKAMISIVLNVGGLIHTVREDGELIDLRMGDLCKDPTKLEFIETITRAVFDVGRVIGAYEPDAQFEEVWAEHRATILRFAGHVTSSLKTFRDALGGGLREVKLFSNEEWILTPLARYAANAGMQAEELLFKTLRREVQQSMARAIKYRDRQSSGDKAGGRSMKLAAQRNIGIELFESGPDDLIVVGTMLDSDHLIKLEITIHLPDEQITRSRLDMIRVPFPVCTEIEAVADRLVGLRIERGVLGEITHRVGGRVGCSHIKELASGMVYFVSSHLVGRRAGVDPVSTGYNHTPPEERFRLTKDLLQNSCLAYCQATAQALDARIGIRRIGEDHSCPIPLGEHEPSFGMILRERARRFGDKVYLRYRDGDDAVSITWQEFVDRANTIARNLIALGIRPGERVGVISENRADMYLVEMAAYSIGAVSVPTFAGYPAPQLNFVLRHAKPRMVVVSNHEKLQRIAKPELPSIERYYCMDYTAECGLWGAHNFNELTEDGASSQEELERRIDQVKPDDTCLIMYTSGTTGPPKGVKLCHRNLISQQKAISQLWDITENDVLMNYLPWHHSFGGLFERYMTLYSGCELCLDDSRGRDIDRMSDNWQQYRPTLFYSVPRVHDMLLTRCREDSKLSAAVFSDRLRFVFTAGASLPATVEAEYRKYRIPVREGWGLTETSPCVTVSAKDSEWRSGYVGFPIPGVQVRISPEGEILVKGPNVMLGYLNDEEATAHVIDEEGWFHTGDLGEFTKDGLRIFGRKDGAFKLTTGEKVHPQRLEIVLANASQYINAAVVVGSGKDYVAALIYPDFSRLREWAASQDANIDDVTDSTEVRELMANELRRINALIEVKYQRICRAILADREPSMEQGELTPSAKIVRKAVYTSFKHEIESLFDADPPVCVIEVGQECLQEV
ncbi:MAG: AMP-binding protein [Planctomycetes bacterium]|nr:AMP-binding protein [Planctomycetota bacterium]